MSQSALSFSILTSINWHLVWEDHEERCSSWLGNFNISYLSRERVNGQRGNGLLVNPQTMVAEMMVQVIWSFILKLEK